jgi:Tfp pilus assembly protein PilV
MVATLILAIVALGMVEFFAKGRMGFNREEHKRTATLLAQEALERTVALPYDQIDPWGEQRTIGSVSYRITVTTQPDAPDPDIKTVLCAVTWQATPTVRGNALLATYVFDN